MAENGRTPNLDSLSLSDTEADDTEDLFASPSVPSKQRAEQRSKPIDDHKASRTAAPVPPPDSEEDALAAHEDALRRELTSLRSMNTVISGITASLEKAKTNMETVSATVNNATTLLTTWTRILSQTEHNQRLILNPNWQGANQDVADGENDEIVRRQENERRDAEEARRARQREAEREEEERRRTVEGGRGTKAKGRGGGRGSTKVGGYVGVGGQGGVRGTARGGGTVGRTGSGIGRGLSGSRGRGRGV